MLLVLRLNGPASIDRVNCCSYSSMYEVAEHVTWKSLRLMMHVMMLGASATNGKQGRWRLSQSSVTNQGFCQGKTNGIRIFLFAFSHQQTIIYLYICR